MHELEDRNLYCTSVPYRPSMNCVFLMDMASLKHIKDITSDGLGSFRNNSRKIEYFVVKNECLFKVKDPNANIKLITTYYRHNSSHDLTKRIVVCHVNGCPKFGLLIYAFSNGEHEVTVLPHMVIVKPTTPSQAQKKVS